VRNHAKLAYNGVAAWLDGTGPVPPPLAASDGLQQQVRLQDGVAQTMKALRHRRGALSLDTIEARAVFDGDDIADLRPDERNRAKELIEDVMIAANVATAKFLEGHGLPSLRRVLRVPERWDRIVEVAAQAGGHLPDTPNGAALEAFLCERRAADPDRFPDLSLSIVKLLGSGEYVVDKPGRAEDHFGLALRDYTHSTAPNRRFPDLITQRLVCSVLRGDALPYGEDELRVLAQHCTEQEDNAAKVERQVRKSAAALLLQSRAGETFDGIVTGASSKGTWVRIVSPAAEGRVVRGFAGMDVGDRVRVKLVGTDVERGFIDFAAA
jgi:exoribonuclease-2